MWLSHQDIGVNNQENAEEGGELGKKVITESEKKQPREVRERTTSFKQEREWSTLRNSSERTRQLRTKKPPLDFTTRACG